MEATYTKTREGWAVRVPGTWKVADYMLEMHSVPVVTKAGKRAWVMIKKVLFVTPEYAVCSFATMP